MDSDHFVEADSSPWEEQPKFGVKSLDRRAKEKHCARYRRDIPHLLLSGSGAARLSRPNW